MDYLNIWFTTNFGLVKFEDIQDLVWLDEGKPEARVEFSYKPKDLPRRQSTFWVRDMAGWATWSEPIA